MVSTISSIGSYSSALSLGDNKANLYEIKSISELRLRGKRVGSTSL